MRYVAKPAFTGAVVLLTSLTGLHLSGVLAAEFTPLAGWDRHLFPSYIIATATMQATPEEKAAADCAATLGDPLGLLGVSLQSPADNAAVKVAIASDTILEPSTFTATMAKKGVRYRVCPPIKYKYKALVHNKQSVPIAKARRLGILPIPFSPAAKE